MSEKNYWVGRWERGETGWHQKTVEPALETWFSGRPRKRVFVPLCGKSLDLKWLLDEGHEVVGCELSPMACEAFFKESDLSYTETKVGPFTAFKGDSITLYCGNIFNLTPEHIGTIDALYDRAALIALPPDVRPKYTAHLLELLKSSRNNPAFEFFQLILLRTPSDENGPPFSVTPEEMVRYYDSHFELIPIHRSDVDMGPPSEARTEECAFLLKPKA